LEVQELETQNSFLLPHLLSTNIAFMVHAIRYH
jgi:hypothetical protein